LCPTCLGSVETDETNVRLVVVDADGVAINDVNLSGVNR